MTKFLQLHLDVLQTTFIVDAVITCATLYVGVITINRERFDASHEGGILKIFTGYFPNKCQTSAFFKAIEAYQYVGRKWLDAMPRKYFLKMEDSFGSSSSAGETTFEWNLLPPCNISKHFPCQ